MPLPDETDDDVPQLSAEAFLALQQFYKEQEEREKLIDLAKQNSDASQVVLEEDWQLSQFWYDDKTVSMIVDIAKKSIEKGGKVALLSCPTLYKEIKNSQHFDEVALYEYDKRFAIHGEDFVFYDYKSPLSIPRDKANYYDLIIADPPFLSEECITKFAVTIKFLAKEKILLCTGAVMADLVLRLLKLEPCSFRPKHRRSLGNEFQCYSNFNVDELMTKK